MAIVARGEMFGLLCCGVWQCVVLFERGEMYEYVHIVVLLFFCFFVVLFFARFGGRVGAGGFVLKM
jgi:hypothetical protein